MKSKLNATIDSQVLHEFQENCYNTGKTVSAALEDLLRVQLNLPVPRGRGIYSVDGNTLVVGYNGMELLITPESSDEPLDPLTFKPYVL